MDEEARAAVEELERDYDETMVLKRRLRGPDSMYFYAERPEDCVNLHVGLMFSLKPGGKTGSPYHWCAGDSHLYEREEIPCSAP